MSSSVMLTILTTLYAVPNFSPRQVAKYFQLATKFADAKVYGCESQTASFFFLLTTKVFLP